MRDLAPHTISYVPRSTAAQLAEMERLQAVMLKRPQEDLRTSHVLHAGLYARTIFVPKGVLAMGALVKIPTVLVVSGDVLLTIGDHAERLTGYAVVTASPGRKQAVLALADTLVTMSFATKARTVEEAEAEFTDEADMLMTRRMP